MLLEEKLEVLARRMRDEAERIEAKASDAGNHTASALRGRAKGYEEAARMVEEEIALLRIGKKLDSSKCSKVR